MRALLLVATSLLAGLMASCSEKPKATEDSHRPANGPLTLQVPSVGAYTGAYINFGEQEDDVTLESIEQFEEQAGKHQAIIAFSSYWGEQSFPATQVQIVNAHDSIPLIFWSPWDRPYREELIQLNGPDKYRLENILSGQWDSYIDEWADAAKSSGRPVMVSLCNEMNGNWFPWSGFYCGAGQPIAGTVPQQFVGPEFFKRTFRYIVDRVRARGATNVLWVFHVNNFSEPYEKWNSFAQYYPGSRYVDWLGLSVYGQMFPEGKWDEFEDMIDKPYAELAAVDPGKPMMLSEWGVGEFPTNGNKADWIANAFDHIEHDFPRLHAAVYWHERWQNSKDMLYSNLMITSSPGAQAAYRRELAAPFWLDRPVYR